MPRRPALTRLCVLVLPLCLLGGPACAGAPGTEARGDAPTDIASFLKVRAPGSLHVTPDGTAFMIDWPDGVNQLYRRAPGAALDAPLTKVSSFPDGIASYAISPDGKHGVLLAGSGGNEQTQMHLYDVASGKLTALLPNPEAVHGFNLWVRDGSGFIYTANDVSPKDFSIYRYDFYTQKATRLLEKPGSWSASDISHDATRLLVGEFRSVSDSRAYELNLQTGELRDLSASPAPTESTPATSNQALAYLPGEDAILLATDAGAEHPRLVVRAIDRSGPPSDPTMLQGVRPVLEPLAAYELDDAQVNPERTLLAAVHNDRGYGTLSLFALPGLEPVALPPAPKGLVSIAQLEGRRLVYSLSNSQSPAIASEYTAPAPGQPASSPRQLTQRMDREPIDLTAFRLPELVSYASFDGLQIPAFLYLPKDAAPGSPVPFVVHFHGGPEGQWRPGFDRVVQYLVSRGFGVMQPNVRGSTGYGRDFHMLDNYTKRWDSVKDGVAAARWLVDKGYARTGKIAAFGGSYGGFMSVATIIEGPDVFGASVNVVGIVNMQTFLEQTKGYRRKLREAEYGPLSDPEFLKSVSSIHRIDEIKVPMLIAHGLNDPRVPIGEALQLAVGLQKRGMDPEMVIFPDEGHGFAKLENRIIFNERLVRFLTRHIGN